MVGSTNTASVISISYRFSLMIWEGNAGASGAKKLFDFSLFFQSKKKTCTK